MESNSSEVDVGLLQRIATRDEAALAALYDRHSRLAYSVIIRILGSPSDAEDVLQETFVRVWSRADTYNALLGSPATWLTRIARNRAIDRLRACRVRGDIAFEPAVHAAEDGPRLGEPVTRDTPETLLESRTTAGAVRTALAILTPAQRALIEAAYFEGYTHSELAARFGVPLGTVKTRIRAGLAAMRDHLEQVNMIPDELEALVLADSVGALDPDERVELQARLDTLTPTQRSEVSRLYDAATAVVLSVPRWEPPAHARASLLAAARKPSTYTVWAADATWTDTGLPGIRARVLAVDKARSLVTLLIRAEPGAVYPSHKHHGPEECLVIRGSVVIDGRVLRAGDFHHADEDSDHGEILTTEGAEVLLVGAIEDYLPAAATPADASGRSVDR